MWIAEDIKSWVDKALTPPATPPVDTPPPDPATPPVDTPKDQPKDQPKDDKPKDDPKKDDPEKPVDMGKKFKTVSYERFKDVNERYKKLKAEKEALIANKKDPEFADEDEKEMHGSFKKMWFQTKEDMELAEIKIKEDQLRDQETVELNKQVAKLETEFDWSDWLPKFTKDEVLKRGMDHQVYDPKSAFIVMNLASIVDYFVKKELKTRGSQPNFAKWSDVREPDITPPEKLSTSDGSLKTHLKKVIEGMLGS